ncbi:hypothetical protein RHOFW104R3_36315 [Rhodanobacter denitrificans]|nr:hypothetical protein RHOFW104R3_36315 [Rhodanobacter denitrificans]
MPPLPCGERAGVRGRAGDDLQNHPEHAFDIHQCLIVPETQHAVSLGLQIPGAALVVPDLFRMLAAIQFNDQHGLTANKINDVMIDLMLAAEFVAIQLPVAQMEPKLLLGIGHGLVQTTCPVDVLAFHPEKLLCCWSAAA